MIVIYLLLIALECTVSSQYINGLWTFLSKGKAKWFPFHWWMIYGLMSCHIAQVAIDLDPADFHGWLTHTIMPVTLSKHRTIATARDMSWFHHHACIMKFIWSGMRSDYSVLVKTAHSSNWWPLCSTLITQRGRDTSESLPREEKEPLLLVTIVVYHQIHTWMCWIEPAFNVLGRL